MRYRGAEKKAKQYRVSDYQDSQILTKTISLKSDILYCFAYIWAPRYCTENCLDSKCTYGCHLSFEYKQSSVQYLEAEIQAKQYRISDFKNRFLVNI